MENNLLNTTIHTIINAVEKLIPYYMQNEPDAKIAKGNVSVCIIDEAGQIHGKMFGADKSRARQTFKVAWIKASQVWLTGVATGEYERMVFNKEVDENANGIEAPDLIGWQGGQPLTLANGTKLSVGFSGFRGVTDLEIMVKALTIVQQQ